MLVGRLGGGLGTNLENVLGHFGEFADGLGGTVEFGGCGELFGGFFGHGCVLYIALFS